MKGREAKGFTSERGRFETFRNWPQIQTATPYEFVQAGFYYSGYSDKVICTFCNGELSNWGPSDIPMEQHRLHFPECMFVQYSLGSLPKVATAAPGISERTKDVEPHQKSTNQIISTVYSESRQNGCTVLKESQSSKVTSTTSSQYCCQRDRIKPHTNRTVYNDQKTPSFDSLNLVVGAGIPASGSEMTNTTIYKEQCVNPTPSYLKPMPDYTVERMRLQSFWKWPLEYPDVVELARAGFYYMGAYDLVKCFACGGLIKCWNRDDDPWIEHAKYFPECKYLHMCLGEDVAKEIHRTARRQFSNDLEEDGMR